MGVAAIPALLSSAFAGRRTAVGRQHSRINVCLRPEADDRVTARNDHFSDRARLSSVEFSFALSGT